METIKKNWVFLILLFMLLGIELNARGLYSAYYETVTKQALQALPSSYSMIEYSPIVKGEAPTEFDLVVVHRTGEFADENYYLKSGDYGVVRSKSGKWLSSEWSYPSKNVAIPFIGISFLLFVIATFSYQLRTGVILAYLPGVPKAPRTRTENLLLLYAVTMFLGTFLM
jgi:hypothetical protein